MEAAGIVQRRLLPRPTRTVYELTKTGVALEPAVVELGRWGAKLLGPPRRDEIITVDALVIALRSTFQPKAAKGVTVSYQLHIGEIALNASILRGQLSAAPGTIPDPDLTIETGPALRDLLAGELSAHEALQEGFVKIRGNRAHLNLFVELFKI